MKAKYSWKIECSHTPEMIDRILSPIRKRGLSVISLNYKQIDQQQAECNLEFEIEEADYARIKMNMLRIHDLKSITEKA
jgi:acetolactate synthase regulatory subunit